MCGLRRGGGAALALLAVLLLLLLARLPPPPAPRRPAPARLAPPSTPAVNPQPEPSSQAPPPSSAQPQPPAKETVAARYVAGHERAHAERCPRLGAKVRILMLISSAPANAAARQAIRLTWGSAVRRSDLAMAFVLGQSPEKLHEAIAAEDELYGDLIIGNFVDSYTNLTLKSVSMLEWADTYCPRADFLLKTDDDMFINVPLLIKFASARVNQTRTIWGRVFIKQRPMRKHNAKYFVPVSEYPARLFPTFATGPAYLVSGDCVSDLRRIADSARFLRLEDVFVTGVLGSQLKLRLRNAPEFLNRRAIPNACLLRRRVTIHQVRVHEQFELWRRLHDPTAKCKR